MASLYKADFIIVGMGLAGSWLAHYLMECGGRVVAIDDAHTAAASRISSGLINPVTGQKLVKTWLADQILPFAQQAYNHVDQYYGTSCYQPFPLIWLLNSVEKINMFAERMGDVGYAPYLKQIAPVAYGSGICSTLGYGVVAQAASIRTRVFAEVIAKRVVDRGGSYVYARLEPSDIQLLPNGKVQWQEYRADYLIFCEGYAACNNPFFADIPFVPAKGELLIVHAPELQTENVIIKGNAIAIVPLGNCHFWVGATYDWQPIDETPTATNRQKLEQMLSETITVPYQIKQHLAGIRPATRRRRPLLGQHSQYPQLAILNGFGTKGASLSPYFAHQLAQKLCYNTPIATEVDWQNR